MATRRAVVYFDWAAYAFSAGIKCRYCSTRIMSPTWFTYVSQPISSVERNHKSIF